MIPAWLVRLRALLSTRVLLGLAILLALACFALLEHRVFYHAKPEWADWWDQGQYIASTRALAQGDWSAAHNWYPVGYSLIAVPFLWALPQDPYVIINAVCMIGSMLAVMRLAQIMGFSVAVGLAVFLLTSVLDFTVLREYVLPWTSTPTCCFILIILSLCLQPPTRQSSFLLGLLAGGILLFKPVDGVAVVPAAFYYLWCLALPKNGRAKSIDIFQNIFAAIAAFSVLAGLTLYLHWRVSGWELSEYEHSIADGRVFVFDQTLVKFYSYFVNPDVLYASIYPTMGFFRAFPWLLPGVCGMVVASCHRPALTALALSMLGYITLYISYFDIIPSGVWVFNFVHYFQWTLPVFGLFAVYLLRDIFICRSMTATALVCVVGAALISFHPRLVPIGRAVVGATGPSFTFDATDCAAPCTVEFDIASPPFDWISSHLIRLDDATTQAIGSRSWTAFPHPKGLRLVLLNTNHIGMVTVKFPSAQPVVVRQAQEFALKWDFGL